MDDLKRTPEVAEEVGITSKYVNTIITRHPHLKPARKIGADYWWTQAELDALKQYKATARPGAKKKVKDAANI